MKFAKYHALGNDYLVLEPSALGVDAAIELAPRLCHRNYGIGSDGILLGPFPSALATAALRIINPDGSEAEKSGNGLRIFARYLWDTGRVTREPFEIETRGGLVTAKVSPEAGLIRVQMGQASFDSEVVGISGPRREVVGEVMDFGGLPLRCSGVSVGNPHCVVIGVAVTEAEARSLGPRIETHPRFKNRTNVQLLEPIDGSNIRIEIWERGAGYTLASGQLGFGGCVRGEEARARWSNVTVHMPGGTLLVEIEPDYRVTQTGPATSVATGIIDRECLSDGAAWTV